MITMRSTLTDRHNAEQITVLRLCPLMFAAGIHSGVSAGDL
jgi:hypothetical protein